MGGPTVYASATSCPERLHTQRLRQSQERRSVKATLEDPFGLAGESDVVTENDPSVADEDPLDAPRPTEPNSDTMLSTPPVISSPIR